MSYVLRELGRGDLPALNRWRADREVVENLGGNYRFVGEEVDARWFENYLANRATNVRLAICAAGADGRPREIVGAVYLLGIEPINRCAEYAIWIGEAAHRGQGAGELATREILRHAFGDLNLNRVYLTVVSGNARARAFYARLGFVEEGVMRQAVFKEGRYCDVVMMSMLASDWAALQDKR